VKRVCEFAALVSGGTNEYTSLSIERRQLMTFTQQSTIAHRHKHQLSQTDPRDALPRASCCSVHGWALSVTLAKSSVERRPSQVLST